MAEVEECTAMISERRLSRSFSGFWSELLPLLTPRFVHLFNETFSSPLLDSQGFPVGEVKKASELSDTAFLAEVAFYLVKLARERGCSAFSAWEDAALRTGAIDLASTTVMAYDDSPGQPPGELTEGECDEILALGQNYEFFFARFPLEATVNFTPKIQGAGFIASCEADIAIGNTLYEVKTISRNIASKDLRQLFIYLALQAATGDRRWAMAGFFNPRRATIQEFNIDDLIFQISGGRLALEVFRSMAEFASVREVEFDAAF